MYMIYLKDINPKMRNVKNNSMYLLGIPNDIL